MLSPLPFNGSLGLRMHFVVARDVITHFQNSYANMQLTTRVLIHSAGRNCQRQTDDVSLRYLSGRDCQS